MDFIPGFGDRYIACYEVGLKREEYEVPIEHEYAEIDAATNKIKYEYIKEQTKSSNDYVKNNPPIDGGYEVPTVRNYAENGAEINTTEHEYTYIQQKNVPTQPHAIHTNTSSQPTTNQANKTLRQERTSQPSWIKRNKITFAVMLSVGLSVIISTAVFVTVLMTVKSNGDSSKFQGSYNRLPLQVLVIINCVALVRQGDNAFDRVRPCVCPFACTLTAEPFDL